MDFCFHPAVKVAKHAGLHSKTQYMFLLSDENTKNHFRILHGGKICVVACNFISESSSVWEGEASLQMANVKRLCQINQIKMQKESDSAEQTDYPQQQTNMLMEGHVNRYTSGTLNSHTK